MDKDIALLKEAVLDPRIDLDEWNVIAVLGFGFGRLVKELINRTDEDILILAIEPKLRMFKSALHDHDLKEVFSSKKLSLAIAEKPTDILLRIHERYEDFKGVSRLLLLENGGFFRTSSQYFEAVVMCLRHAFSLSFYAANTIRLLLPMWIRNVLDNLEAIVRSPGVGRLFNKFLEVPAIIVSAGPSLDKNVGDLCLAKDKALVICVDTALRTLLRRGIRPDLVVSCDGSRKNYDYYISGVDIRNLTLITDPIVYPKTILEFNGHVFIRGVKEKDSFVNLFLDLIGSKGDVPAGGGSVSHYAFNLAKYFGCDPIIFVGLDLCFDGDKTYTNGVPRVRMDEARRDSKEEEHVLIEDIYGKEIITPRHLYNFLLWFRTEIRNDPLGITYIDATEGGAKIQGTHIMPLRQAIKDFCKRKIDVKGILEEAVKNYEPPGVENLINRLGSLIDEYELVINLSKEGRKKAEDIPSKGLDEIDGLFDELEEISQRITERQYFLELNRPNVEEFLYEMKDGIRKIRHSKDILIDLADEYKVFFDKIYDISNGTLPHIVNARNRLNLSRG
ncbi:MAG: DUF115 domain-containing protein [bacterium]|nr:DUF115 domain-containing protein [bacterium]